MKGKWGTIFSGLTYLTTYVCYSLDNFIAESAKLAQVQQQAQPVTDQMVRERIHLSHCNGLEEYQRVFVNLAAKIDEQQIKLIVIDNIHAVCENFIESDNQVDYLARSKFMLKHST